MLSLSMLAHSLCSLGENNPYSGHLAVELGCKGGFVHGNGLGAGDKEMIMCHS